MSKKNKNVQYLLIGMVVLIWGTVAWQFLNYGNAPYQDYTPSVEHLSLQKSHQIKRDSFAILANYKDPFLDKSLPKIAKASIQRPQYNRKAPPKKTKARIPKSKLPKILYNGYATNNNQITRVQLNIEGQFQSLKLNQKLGDLQLKAMYKDSGFLRNRIH